jgi:muramoyltetrapeptide carboxypeptidase
MRRKDFLSLFPGLAALPAITPEAVSRLKTPPFLRPGDVIGFTSPAGYITLEEVEPARMQIESWGFLVRMGSTIGRRDCTFGGADEERRRDLQEMINDPSVSAIMCARGGYGVNRILDLLDLKPLKKHPKWIIGFSDITALHLHVYRQAHIASIHSKMCNSFPKDWETAEPIQQETILSIRTLLEGKPMAYSALPDVNNRLGEADGPLLGGNLAIIASMMGTASEIKTEGAILFLEEVGEYPYSVDRMLTTLQRAGKLSKLKGLIIGGFRMKPEEAGDAFGRDLYDIVLSKVGGYAYPVCFGFPVGHQKPNYALACGRMHRLTVMPEGVVLRQQ